MSEVYQNIEESEIYVPLVAQEDDSEMQIAKKSENQLNSEKRASISTIVISIVFVVIVVVIIIAISLALVSQKTTVSDGLQQEQENTSESSNKLSKKFKNLLKKKTS